MELTPINTAAAQASARQTADLAVARAMAGAMDGDVSALFDLGVFYSTGSKGVACDMIEAHKWFNLAAARGHAEAAHCRAEVADEMSAREIAEAQRLAREWLSAERRRAA
jgi:TPR repeat protein